jgi:hypothetical protein
MPKLTHSPPQTHSFRLRRLLWLTGSAVAVAVAAIAPPPAAADSVYHSEHLDFAAFGAPLRSGFVENIKAEGPTIYAHEIFVLNGARPTTTYSVTRDFFFQNPGCIVPNPPHPFIFHSNVAELRTNASGNARSDVVVEPGDITAGVHGVMWTVRDDREVIAYQTTCTAVTLD